MLKKFMGILMITGLLFQSCPAQAYRGAPSRGSHGGGGHVTNDHGWSGRGGSGHGWSGRGSSYHGWGWGWGGGGWRYGYLGGLPAGYFALAVAGLTYYYCDGLYYRYTPYGYAVVEPPYGAVVPALPPGYTVTMLRETPYYSYDGTYYVAGPGGYRVTEPPVSAPASAPAVAAPASVSAPLAPVAAPVTDQAVVMPKTEPVSPSDNFDVHIPNQDGTFTLVTLKKVDKGFIGPQDELYPDHPTVEQLKILYGKK